MNSDEVEVLSKLIYDTAMSPALFAECLQQGFPNIEIVLITEGAKGCSIFQENLKISVPSDPVAVKDTVGAGDSFCAAFLTTYMKTGDPKKAARIGNMVGGFVASENGAIPDYPADFKRKVGILSGISMAG